MSTRGCLLVLGGNPLHGSDALDSRMGSFLGGEGEGKRNSRVRLTRRFHSTTRVPNNPVYVIYYILCSGGISAGYTRQSRTVTPILDVLDRHVLCFRSRQPVDLVHVLKTVKGLLILVPPRTPRNSGYDVYADVFYVVICYMSVICICLLYVVMWYMSFICYMPVTCLVLGSSCLVFNAHLCNHIQL